MPKVPVVLISDQISDLMKNELYIKRSFSDLRITYTHHLLTTMDLSILQTYKNAVIILSTRLITPLSQSCAISHFSTLIPITFELNDQDIQAIDQAIKFYERQILQSFLDHTKTSS